MIDADALQALIDAGVSAVKDESKAMIEVVVKRVADVNHPERVDEAVVNGLHEIDVYTGSDKTAGLIVAAAALGAAHARGESPSGWPTFDGIVSRAYWQHVAGWTDEEYAKVVKEARERAALSHAAVVLDHAGKASDHGQKAHTELLTGQHGDGHEDGHEDDYLLRIKKKIKMVMKAVELDGEVIADRRAEMIADAEASAHYAAVKYESNLKLATEDEYLVYFAREDEKTRPNHRALHRKAWPVKSPVWRRIMPPNGFKCRCMASRRSAQWVIENLGKDAIRSTVPIGGGPDRGFSGDPRRRRATDWSKYRPTHVSALMNRTER